MHNVYAAFALGLLAFIAAANCLCEGSLCGLCFIVKTYSARGQVVLDGGGSSKGHLWLVGNNGSQV